MRRIGDHMGVIAFLFQLLFLQNALASVDVKATVDRNALSAGETFTLRVSVSSEESFQVHPPNLPNIENVQVVHQWASSQTNSSIVSAGQGVQFKTIRSKIFNFQLLTEKPGRVVIPPISMDVGGTQHRTAQIVVDVGEASSAPPQAQRGRPGGFDDDARQMRDPIDELEERFNQLLNRQFGGAAQGGHMTGPKNEKDAFFILAEVDKTEAFRGEQITASWYLYTRGRVQDIDTLKYPDLQGFWKEDIQISTHLNFEQDIINGIPYSRALLVSYALFPMKEGKTLIDSYKAKATIAGGFGFGRGYQATKSSEEIPVMIKPLPKDGKPKDFTGAVGEFQLNVDAPSKSLVSGQPFSLKVRFEGRGNAKNIELPDMNLPAGVEVYDISNESNFFKNGQSFKEFDVLLVAQKPGSLEIPSLSASFFDPRQEKYITLSSEPIALRILPRAKSDSLGEERFESEDSEEPQGLPLARQSWEPQRAQRSLPLAFWAIGLALLLIGLGFKLVFELGWLSRPATLKEALEHRLNAIDKLAQQKKWRQVGIQATNTIYFTLGEISGEGGANQEMDKMLAKVAPSLRREFEGPIRQLLDEFGVLGFGPKAFTENYKDDGRVEKNLAQLRKLLLEAASITGGGD